MMLFLQTIIMHEMEVHHAKRKCIRVSPGIHFDIINKCFQQTQTIEGNIRYCMMFNFNNARQHYAYNIQGNIMDVKFVTKVWFAIKILTITTSSVNKRKLKYFHNISKQQKWNVSLGELHLLTFLLYIFIWSGVSSTPIY